MRYVYEDPSAAKFYIIDLPRVVRFAILELKPEWSQRPGKMVAPRPRTSGETRGVLRVA
ncbi:MAG: hypothetical protein K0R61_5405 [Microvirga sp.]|jgi:hypothetical protein|nr:hypothetical protein [Microvirga sp.]MDF2974955.1 hypothetical protein [Microvirga sp.]